MPAGRRIGSSQRSTTDATHSTESPNDVEGSLPLSSPTTGEPPTISGGSPCVGSTSSVRSRSRGPTKGKGVQREVEKNKGNKLQVEICPLACTFIGKNATKIANQLGVQIRLSAPLQGVSTWTQIDRGSKDAIIQNVLLMFDIKDFSEQYVQEAIEKKCYSLYKDWRFSWKQKYLELLKDGKDPYVNGPDPARQEDWKYMIDTVWSSDQHKKRAENAKINRAQLPYNHTAGSQSFPAKLSLQAEKLGDEGLPFSTFYKDTHWSKKKNDYVHPQCQTNYDEIVRREAEALESGDSRYTPEQLSQMVLGERSGYLLGFGKGPKPSSSVRSSASSKACYTELEKLKAQIEEQNERMRQYENDRRNYEEKIRRMEEERRKLEDDRRAKDEETQKQIELIFAMMRDKNRGDGSGGTSA